MFRVLVAGSLLLLFWVIWRLILKVKKDPYDAIRGREFMENEEAYREASESVQKTYEMLPVARYRSDQGYNDTQILDLISLLGAEGIEASYQTTFLELIHSYTIFVRAHQVDRAKQILEERARQ